jgi:hypothetical protein
MFSTPNNVVVSGADMAGWTLDGYVIPRLASGLIWAEEVDYDRAMRIYHMADILRDNTEEGQT